MVSRGLCRYIEQGLSQFLSLEDVDAYQELVDRFLYDLQGDKFDYALGHMIALWKTGGVIDKFI